MPQHQSVKKRMRQNETRRLRNIQKRSQMKTAIKKVKNAPDKETASSQLKNTVAILDKMSGKGMIHKNKAANIKSKLTKHVNAM